ncbi:MAG: antibiotic biosynthesis monooxygenase [Thermomicrobiales bacterium]
MYGTVSRIHITPGQERAVEELVQGWLRDRAPRAEGFIGEYILIPEAAPGERLALTVFDSEASYRKHAADPAQHAWYLQFRAHLESDPEWHDGAVTELLCATVPL